MKWQLTLQESPFFDIHVFKYLYMTRLGLLHGDIVKISVSLTPPYLHYKR